MRRWLPLDDDGIALAYVPANLHDAHNPGFPDNPSGVVAINNRGKKTLAMVVNLRAWIAQAGDFHLRRIAYPQNSPLREAKQVESQSRDVFTELARLDIEALLRKFAEQFSVKQMNLAQVGLRRVLTRPRTVLHCFTAMRIALDTEPSQEADDVGGQL